MLDPLTGLGLASNVVQLLDFTTRLVYQTHEFLKTTGTTLPENITVTELARRNKELSDEIISFERADLPLTKCEATAQEAAQLCSGEASLILAELVALEVKPSSNKLRLSLNAFGKGARSRAKRRSLEARQEKLRRLESHLATALLHLILRNQNSEFDDLRNLLKLKNVHDERKLIDVANEIGCLIREGSSSIRQAIIDDSTHQIDGGAERREVKKMWVGGE